MAFESTLINQGPADGGVLRKVYTFTNGGSDTGGAISTGFTQVLWAEVQHTGGAVIASAPVYSVSGGTVTLVTVADADGVVAIYGK